MKFSINRSVIYPILGVNLVFFLLQNYVSGFTSNLILVTSDIFVRPWILLSHMFLHGGGYHIFFNMYALILFGPILEQRVGPTKFLQIYLTAGLLAGFISSVGYIFLGESIKALGASGAVMGMVGAMVILLPNLRLLFMFMIPMPLWVAGIVWAAMDIFGVFFQSGVGNGAHLIGMATGLIFGYYLKKNIKNYEKKFKNKKHLTKNDVEEYLRSGRI